MATIFIFALYHINRNIRQDAHTHTLLAVISLIWYCKRGRKTCSVLQSRSFYDAFFRCHGIFHANKMFVIKISDKSIEIRNR